MNLLNLGKSLIKFSTIFAVNIVEVNDCAIVHLHKFLKVNFIEFLWNSLNLVNFDLTLLWSFHAIACVVLHLKGLYCQREKENC
jgi:hypothetical protein